MVGTSVMSLNLILPALGSLAQSFGLSYAAASFVFSGYLIVTGVMTLVMGPLSDRFGRRPIVLTALSIFIVASLCSALAPNVVLLFVFRFFQAVVVAAGVLAQAAVRDTSASQSDTTRKLALIAMAMALVPLIGPMVGGVIADLMGWRAVFMAQAGVGALTLLLCVFDLNETNQQRSATFLAQFRAYPGLVSSLRFWGYVMTLCMGVAVFFSFLAGMPLIAKARFGFGETMIGVMLGTLTLGYLVANGVLRQISDRFMQAGIMVFARALGVIGPLISMALIALGFTNPIVIFAPLVLMGAANGLSLPLANSGHRFGSAGSGGVGGGAVAGTGVMDRGAVLGARQPAADRHSFDLRLPVGADGAGSNGAVARGLGAYAGPPRRGQTCLNRSGGPFSQQPGTNPWVHRHRRTGDRPHASAGGNTSVGQCFQPGTKAARVPDIAMHSADQPSPGHQQRQ